MSSVSSANSKTGNMLKCWCAFLSRNISAPYTHYTHTPPSHQRHAHTYAHSLALTLPYSQHVDAISFASTCSITVHRTRATLERLHNVRAHTHRSKGSENLQMHLCLAISLDYTVYNFQVHTYPNTPRHTIFNFHFVKCYL